METEQTQPVPLEDVQPETIPDTLEAVSAEESRLEDLVLGIRRNPNHGFSGKEISDFEEKWAVVRQKKLALVKDIPPPPRKPIVLGSERENNALKETLSRDRGKAEKKVETSKGKMEKLSERISELEIRQKAMRAARGDIIADGQSTDAIDKELYGIGFDLQTARDGIGGFDRLIAKTQNEIAALSDQIEQLTTNNRRHEIEKAVRDYLKFAEAFAETVFNLSRLHDSPAYQSLFGEIFFTRTWPLNQLGLPKKLPNFYLYSDGKIPELGLPVDFYDVYRDTPAGRASREGQGQPPSPFIK